MDINQEEYNLPKSEILDHEGEFWDEVAETKMIRGEAIPARLQEIKQVHNHENTKERLNLNAGGRSIVQKPAQLQWIYTNRGCDVNHEDRSRLVAMEM